MYKCRDISNETDLLIFTIFHLMYIKKQILHISFGKVIHSLIHLKNTFRWKINFQKKGMKRNTNYQTYLNICFSTFVIPQPWIDIFTFFINFFTFSKCDLLRGWLLLLLFLLPCLLSWCGLRKEWQPSHHLAEWTGIMNGLG